MAADTLLLRPAREADVPELIEIARRAWLSAFAQTAPFGMLQTWFALDREPGWYTEQWPAMTVAEAAGAVVGLVQPRNDEVNGLWVHPRAQGAGLGARLLEEAEHQIASAGHSVAWLTCSTFNPRAQAFYERCGYRVTRRYTERFGNMDEEIVRLEKPV